MSLKGKIEPFHHPVNLFRLLVTGPIPFPLPFTATKISGLEQELETVELPDRTRVSGGQTKPVTFTVELPSHHLFETAYMEVWFREAQEAVSRTYKRDATLTLLPVGDNPTLRGGGVRVTYVLIGVFPTKRKTPDLDMANEGEMGVTEWEMSADEIFPIPISV